MEKAVEKLEIVTDKREDILGSNDLDTLESKQFLARSLIATKNFKDGLRAWREVVTCREVMQGFLHPRTVAAQI